MKNNENAEIRSAENVDEVKEVMALAITEGWNVGKHDAVAYFHAFPKGCKVLIIDGKVVGGILLAEYEKNFIFIGLFIVKNDLRGQGYGKKIWEDAISYVQDQAAGLYAVPQQVSRYKSSGFNSSNEIWRLRKIKSQQATNLFTGNKISQLEFVNESSSESSQELGGKRNLSQELLEKVEQYDSQMFPVSRFRLIKAMLQQGAVGFAIQREEKVVGFGMIRQCQTGYRVGPLYANNFEDAQALTEGLFNVVQTPDEKIIFDAPVNQNKFLIQFTEYFNLEHIPSDDTSLMFKGEVPGQFNKNAESNYALCSLETG